MVEFWEKPPLCKVSGGILPPAAGRGSPLGATASPALGVVSALGGGL